MQEDENKKGCLIDRTTCACSYPVNRNKGKQAINIKKYGILFYCLSLNDLDFLNNCKIESSASQT